MQHRFGSTLAQVMACYLLAPSHYLNQCWLTIKETLNAGIHSGVMFTWLLKISIPKLCLNFTHLKPQRHLSGTNELIRKSTWTLWLPNSDHLAQGPVSQVGLCILCIVPGPDSMCWLSLFTSTSFQHSLGHKSSWWRHQMETYSVYLALSVWTSPVTSEFPAQRPVAQSFDVSFDLCLNKQLCKQLWGWWFETPLHSLWCHSNVETKNTHHWHGCQIYLDTWRWQVEKHNVPYDHKKLCISFTSLKWFPIAPTYRWVCARKT